MLTRETLGDKRVLPVLIGAATGPVLVFLGAGGSPYIAAALLVGMAVVGAIFAWPFFGMLLVGLAVPVERLGRLTDDASTYTFSVMRFLGLLALASVLVHCLLGKRKLWFPAPLVLYLAFLAIGLVSLMNTSDLTGGLRQASTLMGNLLFLLLVVNVVRSREQAEWPIVCWMLTTAAIGLFTIYQWHDPAAVIADPSYYRKVGSLTTADRFATVIYDAPPGSPGIVKRALGSTSHPAVYGINVILALPFYAYFARVASSAWIRYASAIGAAIACFNVLLTNTRGALMTLAVVLALVVVTGLVRATVRSAAALALLAVVMVPFIPSSVYERAFDMTRYSGERADTLQEREMFWRAGLDVIADRWLLGIGLGNQNALAARVTPLGTSPTRSTHTDYLQTLVETGLVGALALAAFLVSLHRRCRRAERRFRAEGEARTALLLTAARVAFYAVLVNAFHIETLTLPLKGFWLSMGIVVALSEVVREAMPRGGPAAGEGGRA